MEQVSAIQWKRTRLTMSSGPTKQGNVCSGPASHSLAHTSVPTMGLASRARILFGHDGPRVTLVKPRVRLTALLASEHRHVDESSAQATTLNIRCSSATVVWVRKTTQRASRPNTVLSRRARRSVTFLYSYPKLCYLSNRLPINIPCHAPR